jgi:hypothetical protein
MLTDEQKIAEAAEAEKKLRDLVVAAGILTAEESIKYLQIGVASRSQLPAGVVPEPCCSGCGHDMSDAVILRIGIATEVGEEKRDAIFALLENAQTEN